MIGFAPPPFLMVTKKNTGPVRVYLKRKLLNIKPEQIRPGTRAQKLNPKNNKS